MTTSFDSAVSHAVDSTDLPPGWMKASLPGLPERIADVLGAPAWDRSGCAITAVLMTRATPGVWLARLAPAPFCIDADFADHPVGTLFDDLVGSRGSTHDCWAALVVERTATALEQCDVSWVYAMLEAAEQRGLATLDVLTVGPFGRRLVCESAVRHASTGSPESRRVLIRHAVEVEPEKALHGYHRDARGQWVLPRACTLA